MMARTPEFPHRGMTRDGVARIGTAEPEIMRLTRAAEENMFPRLIVDAEMMRRITRTIISRDVHRIPRCPLVAVLFELWNTEWAWVRTCHHCHRLLYLGEALGSHLNNGIPFEYIRKLWDDPLFEFLCCTCFQRDKNRKLFFGE